MTFRARPRQDRFVHPLHIGAVSLTRGSTPAAACFSSNATTTPKACLVLSQTPLQVSLGRLFFNVPCCRKAARVASGDAAGGRAVLWNRPRTIGSRRTSSWQGACSCARPCVGTDRDGCTLLAAATARHGPHLRSRQRRRRRGARAPACRRTRGGTGRKEPVFAGLARENIARGGFEGRANLAEVDLFDRKAVLASRNSRPELRRGCDQSAL